MNLDVSKWLTEVTDEQQSAIDKRLADFEAREHASKIHAAERSLNENLGRYKGFSISRYEIYHDNQPKVLERIKGIASRIDEFVGRKMNLICFGSVGTGKDLLATWLLRAAASRGHQCRWIPARDFYDDCSSAFQEGSTQKKLFEEISRPTVLCLSDPVFHAGWRDTYGEYLSKIIRRRYDKGKATWVTANVADESQASQMFGTDVWSRLQENSVTIKFRWPDYRERK